MAGLSGSVQHDTLLIECRSTISSLLYLLTELLESSASVSIQCMFGPGYIILLGNLKYEHKMCLRRREGLATDAAKEENLLDLVVILSDSGRRQM